jgi:hypothetical protein
MGNQQQSAISQADNNSESVNTSSLIEVEARFILKSREAREQELARIASLRAVTANEAAAATIHQTLAKWWVNVMMLVPFNFILQKLLSIKYSYFCDHHASAAVVVVAFED